MPGFTPPLLLQGGATLASFNAEITILRAAYLSVGAAQDDVKVNLAKCNNQMAAAYERMKQYRAGRVAVLPPGDPLLDTIPDLTPSAGPAVEAVTLAGVGNAATSKADLSWNASNR